MATIFLRPDHLHVPANVLSSTSEAGLTTQPATPATANKGVLRLRPAGEPLAAVDADILLQSGGNPTGPSVSHPAGSGAAQLWKNTSDASTEYRGFTDTPVLARVTSPVSAYVANRRTCSVPRQLSDGSLGFLIQGTGSVCKFNRIDNAGVLTETTTGASSDFLRDQYGLAVLATGRLIALVAGNIGHQWDTWYSDDLGVTWALLSTNALVGDTSYGHNNASLEVVGDVLVAVIDHHGTGDKLEVWTSYDGGVNFVLTGTHATKTGPNPQTCVTKTGRVLMVTKGTVNAEVTEIIPGGGFGETVQGQVGDYDGIQAICCRDDGTIFVWGFNTTASNAANMEIAVSVDDGATFTLIDSDAVFDLGDTPTANAFASMVVGSWHEQCVMLVTTQADTGSDHNVLALIFGEYDNTSEVVRSDAKPYGHTYVPVDYPDALGWTAATLGAGATITNQQTLRLIGTAADNTLYSAPATFWNPSAGDSRRLRFRLRVNTGGSKTLHCSKLKFAITDGVNQQFVQCKFDTTGFEVTDGPGNSLGSVSLTMTEWTDIKIAFQHDSTAGQGQISLWTKQDADQLWTNQINGATVVEDVGASNILAFGGEAGSYAVNWQILLLETSDNDTGMASGFTNPGDLTGRPLQAAHPMYLTDGLLLAGMNGAGMPGDSYTLQTAYSYDKRNLWREFRPSRQLRSTSDGTALRVVFDAGVNNVFTAKHVAMFGTNARTITFEMNATDSWGAPSVSQAMTTQIATGTTSTGNRGPGFIGPSSGTWIPGQFRSDGDAHRYFITVADDTYEITDNDQQTIYVEGVDFSAQGAATFYIFSDRAGAVMGSTERYRFMRVSIAAQDTSDEYLKLSTLIVGEGFTPDIDYSHNFTDRVAPNVTVQETEAGYKSSARVGPRKYNVSIQWDPINRMHADYGTTGEQIEAFYAAIEGENKPIAFWRDTDDIDTLRLVRVEGTLSRPNQRGELATGLARVDTLILSEEL